MDKDRDLAVFRQDFTRQVEGVEEWSNLSEEKKEKIILYLYRRAIQTKGLRARLEKGDINFMLALTRETEIAAINNASGIVPDQVLTLLINISDLVALDKFNSELYPK